MKLREAIVSLLVLLAVGVSTSFGVLWEGFRFLGHTSIISYCNYFIIVVISLLCIYQKRYYGIRKWNKIYFIFFVVYHIYIFLDITILRKIPFADMASAPGSVIDYFYRLFLLIGYLFCADTIIDKLNIKFYLLLSFVVGIIPSVLYVQLVGFDVLQSQVIKEDDVDYFNLLTIGYVVAPIVVLSFLYFKNLFQSKFFSILFNIVVIALGTYVMIAISKRGAFLWLIVNLGLCVYYISKKSKKYVIAVIISFILLYANKSFVVDSVKEIAPRTGYRLEYTLDEGDTSRFDLKDAQHSTYLIGINNFLSSPLIGNYFRLETSYLRYKGSYPHNLFIEVLMTMGLIGFILFFCLLKRTFSRSFKYFRKGYTPNQLCVLSLFFASFLQLQTTGSLLFKNDFWLFMFVLCSIDTIGKKYCNQPISIENNAKRFLK